MKLSCPKNKRHKRFSTYAHVAQDWEVDEHGEFVECIDSCTQVVHKPDEFTCLTCGTPAKES